jgi:hypothetical protein
VDVCGVLTFEWVAVLQQGKAWMLQLLSVACLSLAAKMEETEVPILLDLQVLSHTIFWLLLEVLLACRVCSASGHDKLEISLYLIWLMKKKYLQRAADAM